MDTADIAREVGVRYQHAYNVLKRSNGVTPQKREKRMPAPPKPTLTSDILLKGGFLHSATWRLTADILEIDQPLPKDEGVYAFAKEGQILYVGVATMGLSKRIYFYRKPGSTQRTSLRIHGLLREQLASCPSIEILTAVPDNHQWNGLPVHGGAGLELGLIKNYTLPWNVRSAR